MRYAAAFKKLGYDIRLPLQHWSCASETGVCLSLWRKEIDWQQQKFDTFEDAGPTETWSAAGSNQRIRDLSLAVNKFDGWVDVVVVDGVLGEGVDDAHPWDVKIRRKRWRVVRFDEKTGHFRAELFD